MLVGKGTENARGVQVILGFWMLSLTQSSISERGSQRHMAVLINTSSGFQEKLAIKQLATECVAANSLCCTDLTFFCWHSVLCSLDVFTHPETASF